METVKRVPTVRRDFDPARRTLLKTGVAGAAVLLLGRWLAPASAIADGDMSYVFLTADEVTMLRRIVPVMLEGALPPEVPARAAVTEIISSVDQTAAYLPPAVRQELRDLFNLLNTGVTRALLAGVWGSWVKASDQNIAEFLSRWKDSRFNLLRSAYCALHDLTAGNWYSNPKSWNRIGYDGPPKLT